MMLILCSYLKDQGVLFVELTTLRNGVLITITNVVQLVRRVPERHVGNASEGSCAILVMLESLNWEITPQFSPQRLSISLEGVK